MWSSILKRLGLVPDWLIWAVLGVALSAAAWGWHGHIASKAIADAVKAERARVQALTNQAKASITQTARTNEHQAQTDQTERINELQKTLDERDARVAALADRLRKLSSSGRGDQHGGGVPQAAGADPAPASAGLRAVAGADPIVVDGQGQQELAELAVRANEVRKQLITTAGMLADCQSLTEKSNALPPE